MKRIILSLLFVVCQLLICQAQSSDHKTMVSTYRLAGPYEVVARDGEFRKSKAGSKRDMSGKPKWYSTADFVPMFVGSHVENLKFNK